MAIENTYLGKGTALMSGFDYQSSSPLDSRQTVPSYSGLDALVNANAVYTGMIVYVEEDKKTYQYLAGSWIELKFTDTIPTDIAGNAATASKVKWDGVEGKPTTLEGYGINDAYTKTVANSTFVPVTDVATTAAANKILKLDADGKLPASVIAGTISIDNLPKGALERCVVVADDTARFKLTSEHIQTGDTVKVTATNKMYFVKDDTKLNSEDGYEIYAAGLASSVDWTGITNKPTTLTGYGITDVYTKEEIHNLLKNFTPGDGSGSGSYVEEDGVLVLPYAVVNDSVLEI